MRTLQRGDRGADVLNLQVLIKKLGYDPGSIDGIFGGLTERAIKDFQSANHLVMDGIVGSITYQTLQRYIPGDGEYIIQLGDTLYSIAKKYHTTIQHLLAWNPGIDPNNLRINQRIKVPTVTKLRSIAGWIPYWTQDASFQVYKTYAHLFEIMSPFWYSLDSNGGLVKFPDSENRDLIQFAESNGEKIIPLISNDYNGQLVSGVINHPSLRQNHIRNIINKVGQMGYNGIEIDYENLHPGEKEIFSTFIRELAEGLHAKGKLLIVTVHAKTNDQGISRAAFAHDYEALGKAADGIRIMAYDYHWSGGSAGSIAPANWVKNVLSYAVSKIPAHKVILGMPTYGYDWDVSQCQRKAKSVTYTQAIELARTYKAQIYVDLEKGPHFYYKKEGLDHEVWFIDAGSFARLLDLVNHYGIQGIAIWYPGGEDPGIYEAIRQKLLLEVPSGDS